jgi:hypothetical protein
MINVADATANARAAVRAGNKRAFDIIGNLLAEAELTTRISRCQDKAFRRWLSAMVLAAII